MCDWILLDIFRYTHQKHWITLSLVSKRWHRLVRRLIEDIHQRKRRIIFSSYLLGLHTYKPRSNDIIRRMQKECQELYLRNLLRRGSPHRLLSKALQKDCRPENILILIDESLRLNPEGTILTNFKPRETHSGYDTTRTFLRMMIRGEYSFAGAWTIILESLRLIDVIELLHRISKDECAWGECKIVSLLSILEPVQRDIALVYAITKLRGRPRNIGKYVRNLKYKSCRDLVENKLGRKFSRWRLLS